MSLVSPSQPRLSRPPIDITNIPTCLSHRHYYFPLSLNSLIKTLIGCHYFVSPLGCPSDSRGFTNGGRLVASSCFSSSKLSSSDMGAPPVCDRTRPLLRNLSFRSSPLLLTMPSTASSSCGDATSTLPRSLLCGHLSYVNFAIPLHSP